MAKLTDVRRPIAIRKIALATTTAAALAGVVAGGLLLSAGASGAPSSAKPQPVPTTRAQILADARHHEMALVRAGMLRMHEMLARAELARIRRLSPSQRSALEKALQARLRKILSARPQKGPAEKAGFYPIVKGVGPWGICAFYAHNLYVSPPMGPSGIQYEVYAGNIPSQMECTTTDPAATPTSGYGGIVEGIYNRIPPVAAVMVRSPFKSPLVAISADGDLVTLRTLSGRTITFSMVSHTFST
jgi:hypothetical protein